MRTTIMPLLSASISSPVHGRRIHPDHAARSTNQISSAEAVCPEKIPLLFKFWRVDLGYRILGSQFPSVNFLLRIQGPGKTALPISSASIIR